MSKDCLPPSPLSYYGDHNRYDWYYKKTGKIQKQGQSWDVFGAWGQERLLMEKRDGQCKLESSRLLMSHRALHCTVPTLPTNCIKEGEDADPNPCEQPTKELNDLTKIKESILYRIAMVKNKRKKYGIEVNDVSKTARNLLRQVRKQLQRSPVLSSDDEEEPNSSHLSCDDNSEVSDKAKKSRRPADKSQSEEVNDSLSEMSLEELKVAIDHINEHSPLVDRVLCGMHRDERLFTDIRIPQLPAKFIGGCLSSAQTHSGESYLAHSTGADMSHLTVKQVSQGEHFTKMSVVGSARHDTQLNQVEITSYGDMLLAVTRGANRMWLYDIGDGGVSLSDTIETSNSSIEHVCLNPYYPESVYVTNNSILRWDPHSPPIQLLSDWTTRFPVDTDLRSVHYGCNPRHLVITDPTVCSVFDTRSRSCGVDLFEVPSNTNLHLDERLVTSVQSTREFTHYILSHHTLLAVDERFPKYPVLYQLLPTLSWPMLISNTAIDSSTDLLLVGCSTNQEVFSMLVDSSSSVFKSTPIWKCSQPSDVSYFYDTQPPISNRRTVDSRLRAGLLGLSASKQENSRNFTVHMLTGKGDLFEQTYIQDTECYADNSRDVTHAAGPRLSKVDIPPHVPPRCRYWYDMVAAQYSVSNLSSQASEPPVIVVPKESLSSAYRYCNICNGKTTTGGESTEVDIDTFQCLACGLFGHQRKSLLSSLETKKYCEIGEEAVGEPSLLSSFQPEAKAREDANSKLFIQLWNGDDISENLLERDQEWDVRREKMQRAAAGDGSIISGDFDDLSSLSSATKRTKSGRTSASRFSLNMKRSGGPIASAPGFSSPRDFHRKSRSEAVLEDDVGVDMLSSTLPSNLWIGDTSTPPTFSSVTARSLRKNKTKSSKGF